MGKWVDKAGLQYVIDWFKNKLNTKVDKVSGKGLSTNDFTDEAKQKLDTIAPGANNYILPAASTTTLGGIKLGNGLTTDANGFVNVTGGTASEVAWNNVGNTPTSLEGYGIEDAVTLTEFNSLKNKVTGAYKYAGTVSTVDDLANVSNPRNGDIYNVEATGMNYAWNEDESKWDELGANIDLSNYVQFDDLLALTTMEIDEMTGYATTLESFNNLLTKSNYVELGGNLTATEPIVIAKDMTIDLCGHNLTGTTSNALFNVTNGTLTLKGEGSVTAARYIGQAQNGGKIVVESGDYTSTTDVGFGAVGEGSKVTIKGGNITAREGGVGAFDGGELQIDGGTITGTDNFPVFTNGTAGRGGNTITLNGGKLIGNIISSGYEACGIYIANNDTFVMNGGEVIANGGVGILMRAGTVVINDGKITATGEAGGEGGWVGDNKTKMSKSAVIYHETANYPGKAGMSLEINGGTFIGVDHSLEVLSNEAVPNVTVNGGTFIPTYPEE